MKPTAAAWREPKSDGEASFGLPNGLIETGAGMISALSSPTLVVIPLLGLSRSCNCSTWKACGCARAICRRSKFFKETLEDRLGDEDGRGRRIVFAHQAHAARDVRRPVASAWSADDIAVDWPRFGRRVMRLVMICRRYAVPQLLYRRTAGLAAGARAAVARHGADRAAVRCARSSFFLSLIDLR